MPNADDTAAPVRTPDVDGEVTAQWLYEHACGPTVEWMFENPADLRKIADAVNERIREVAADADVAGYQRGRTETVFSISDDDLLIRCDSLLSLIQHREPVGLSNNTRSALATLLPPLRRRTVEAVNRQHSRQLRGSETPTKVRKAGPADEAEDDRW